MFTIYVKKDALEFEREVGNKDQFVDALGTLYDMMEDEIKEGNELNQIEIEKKVYEEVWDRIFERTNFDNERDFWDWMDLMKRKGIQELGFNYEEFAEDAVNEYIRDETDYYDLDEMKGAMEEMRGALEDIYSIADRHRCD